MDFNRGDIAGWTVGLNKTGLNGDWSWLGIKGVENFGAGANVGMEKLENDVGK